MVDLHMHTLYSDGSDTVLELLNKCNNLNLKYISITDHDSCKAHIEIFENKLYKNFNGIIIPGVEVFHSSFNEDNMRELYEYAKINKLLISGGSDYHGTVKPNISLMTGINNNLLIKAEYISWLD